MADFHDSDIAIVGMALRVSGASTPEQYWANLRDGVESHVAYSEAELLERGVSRSDLADPNYVRAGMPMQDLEQFDPDFFGFSAKEAAILDPQHRHFYEVAWEAFERAGHPPAAFDGAIGVFAGCGMGAYFMFNLLSNPDLVDSVGLFLLRHTGNDKDFLSTRVSYAFDLKGPSFSIQTACSTSLVAVHLAVQSLLAGECDLALAGGATIELPHNVGYHYKEGEVLSPDGHCRAFDHRSQGTVFGSGAGVVVLRRMRDALDDGDHIHAVIKGSAVNNDGSQKVGYLAPSVEGQSAAVAEALAVADISAETLSYVECHGTGTPVGDPIEIAALTRAFRETSQATGHCRIGSVKTNIGHLDTAAGVASLIKACLALEHEQIPPSLNFEAPNPNIAFDGSPFFVASSLTDWPRQAAPRRAGINSLGVGGTNAFAILQEAPKRAPTVAEGPQLIVLSTKNRKLLDTAGERLADWLEQHPEQSLADISYTLLQGRHAFEQRRVFACSSREEAVKLLRDGDARRVFTHTKEVDRPSLVFMYPGGGAQYFRMSLGLYEREPVFREYLDRGLELLATKHQTNLRSIFFPDDECRTEVEAKLAKPSVQLPLIFLIEYALTKLWAHYGVEPKVLIGHSMGENTAACVAGVISFEDALGLVLLRGQLVDQTPTAGMLSVTLPADELHAHLSSELDLAAANSPQLSVASGLTQHLDELEARLQREEIESQRVRINVAAHSRLLDCILDPFRQYLQSIELKEPKIPMISNRTGKWLESKQACDPEYWVGHLRNTVLFADGVDTLLEDDERVFVEVGPGSILGSFVRQNQEAPAQRVFGSLRHPDDETADDVYFRTALGRMSAVGIDFDTGRLWPKTPARVVLPTYPFQHAPYWIEPGEGFVTDKRDLARPLKLENHESWYAEPAWIQQGIIEETSEPSRWLVFCNRDALSAELLEKMRAAGNEIVTVECGDTFAQIDEHSYTIAPEAGGSGYQDLVDSLEQSSLLPDRILHLWLLTTDRSFRPGSSFFHRNQEYGFYALFYLARALGKVGVTDDPLDLLVVANGAQQVSDEDVPYPEKATALGPCAVIPREYPEVSCRFVDIRLPSDAGRIRAAEAASLQAQLVDALLADTRAKPGSGVIAWREGVRFERHVLPHRKQEIAPVERLKRNGVYLVTGGFGGIGSTVAAHLAKEYAAKIVLVGRTPVPAREDWDRWLQDHDSNDSICRSILTIRRIESLGGQVLPVAADVTVVDQMREVVEQAREAFGTINGVFHAAGLIRDSLIALKNQRDIEEVFAAKLYGTLVLDELFRNSDLEFMILFSSTSVFIAPQGQIDYVAANAFMNAFAESCRDARAYPVTAINWGIWKDVGMVSMESDRDSSDIDTSHAAQVDTSYPLFEHRHVAREGVDEVHIFTGTLSAEADWVIDDHRLASGEALLPGTGYLELIRAAVSEIGNEGPWQIDRLVFQNPFYVEDEAPRDFRIRFRGQSGRWEAEVLGAVPGETQWERCAVARVAPVRSDAPESIDLTAIRKRCAGPSESAGGTSTLRTAQEGHIDFGPHWHVLKRLQLGGGEAIADLKLADELVADLGEFKLHPGLVDIATGCAMDLIPGYADEETAQNLWVPISYRSFQYFRPLPRDVVSWIRLSGDTSGRSDFAAFDVTLCDRQGQVLAEVREFSLRQLPGTLQRPAAPKPLPTAEGDIVSTPAKKLTPGEEALEHNRSQGILGVEGTAALERVLEGAMPAEIVVSSMDLGALIAQAESVSEAATTGSETRFARPELDSDFEPPRNEFEKGIAEIWGDLLGVEGIGINDSFFDLGGHSLIAVRLFNELADRYDADLPMSVLMQSPTVAALAELIGGEAAEESAADAEKGGEAKESAGSLRYQYVVPMQTGPVAGGTPFFVVAGMFGNVLNLSHLAHLLGEDHPFYAVQARGLYGDAEPHETFEEAAADYIKEIRQVQPEGPYLLGGYSGGGLIAYEIARQLLDAGEEILAVVMLDTPVRVPVRLSLIDKLSMLAQGAKRGGFEFFREKVRDRIRWEKEKLDRRRGRTAQDSEDPMRFQSNRIGDAFVRGLARYEVPELPVRVAVYRPKLSVRYHLSGGRRLDADRNLVEEDNGWTPYVGQLDVIEVPGDHDSMVLEPTVRVLVSAMKQYIEKLDRGHKPSP